MSARSRSGARGRAISGSGSGAPREFWPRALARHSLREPLQLPAPLSRSLCTATEAFALLVAAADRVRRGEPTSLRLCLGEARGRARSPIAPGVAADGELLPRRADGTLAGYAERLRRRHAASRFALLLDDCQTHSLLLWERVRDFAAGLIEHTGFPLGGISAALVAGNAPPAPPPIGRGERDVFTWIAEGHLRFAVRPGKTRGQTSGASLVDLRTSRARAQRLGGGADDLLFWPRHREVVAEHRTGELSAALQLYVDPRSPARRWAQEQLGELAALAVGEPALSRGAAPASAHRRHLAEELPADLVRVAAAVAEGSLAQRFERDLRLRWMAWRSGCGVPPPSREPLCSVRYEDRLYAPLQWPIARVEWRGLLLCAANGYGFAVPTWRGMQRHLELLDSGEEFRVRDLVSSLPRSAEAPHLQSFFAALLSCRALSYVDLRAARRATAVADPVVMKSRNTGA